jgi:hypothetical protein
LGCIIILLVCLVAAWALWQEFDVQITDNPTDYRATDDIERALTETYGDEVREAIERFESGRSTVETHRNPDTLSEYFTGPFLEYMRDLDLEDNEPPWWVIGYVNVEGVRVLEYTPQRFKAIGCGLWYNGLVLPEGELYDTLRPWHFQNLYVFASEDDVWKAVTFIDIRDIRQNYYRDWTYVPDWEKEALGDVTLYFYRDCISDS